MVKFQKKKFFGVIVITAFVFVVHIYYSLNNQSWAWYLHSGISDCRTPMDDLQELSTLVTDIHDILETFGLTNVLVYGSLFGAIRYKNPLPWDNDVDILVRQEELNLINEERLKYCFRAKNMKISYRYWMGGYRVTRGKARGDLMIFRNVSGTMKRVGVESYLFFLNYKNYHSFPARLIEKPLPLSQFCGVNFSVPRYGLEIQKYHYPQDWWLEKKPKGCNNV